MILFVLIFFVIIIGVGASAVVGFSLYLKHRTKRLKGENNEEIDTVPPYRSLFAPDDEEIREFERTEKARDEKQSAESRRQSMLSRAAANDLAVLNESKADSDLYGEILNCLFQNADSDEKISSLAVFILRNGLVSNAAIVEKFAAVWQKNPDKISTINYLELAARSGSAKVYLNALESVADEKENLSSLKEADLIMLAEADFRLLPENEISSGAGFLVKEKIAQMKNEI
ncbi:MAG: hypothetical protein ACR2LT_02475 [Pyrinomonadaceae bacterium]